MTRPIIVGVLGYFIAGAVTAQAQMLPPSSPATGPTALPYVAPPAMTAPPGAGADRTLYTPSADAPYGGQLSITPEYLLWWLRGDRLPPLATSSPSGTPLTSAGVLGAPGTQTLFGDQNINGDRRSGGRLTADYWFDSNQTWGFEARFFMLEALTNRFYAQSNGNPILGRPFINTASGQADAELVAFPGILDGAVTAAARSSNLLGAEALLRGNLLCCRNCQSAFRLDALVGYRFLYLDETLGIQENLTSTSTTIPVPVGTGFIVSDKFNTHNVFNGGELGLAAGYRYGAWTLDAKTSLAMGWTGETTTILGSTASTVPGGPTTLLPGGLLGLNSNIGRHSESAFSLVPELDLNVGYWITDHLRVTAGYSLLFWTNIVRPGEQIDPEVNPNLLPPVLPGGVPHPAFYADRSTLWAQGVSVGFEIRY